MNSEKTERDKKAIAVLYIELSKAVHNENYERAVKTTNKILNLAPLEEEAFIYKILSLIYLNKFEEAISFLNKNPTFANLLIFEKAYCLYRINKHEEALKLFNQIPELDFRFKELKAQILYRLEKYNEAACLYQEIIKNTNDEYEDERHTNLSAALSFSKDSETLIDIDCIRDNSYETCFNKACILINHGLYNEAEKKLKQCERLCREILEEDEASEEEIDVDLALIRIQLAFVYQKQGRIKEAHQIYLANLKIKLQDAALIAVASNNVVCINKDQNLFDSKKKMKAAINDGLIYKLPSRQRKFIALNNAILNYYLHQPSCEHICKAIEKNWPELSIYTTILRALTLVQGNDFDAAIKLLEMHSDLYLKLCLVQLYLIKGDRLKACNILENLGDDSYKPGIVGALTTLYLGSADEEKALKIFEKSVYFYKKNYVNKIDLTCIWRQAADFHIRNGHAQVAVNSLEELLKTNKNNQKLLAQLILACSQYDKNRALDLSTQLPTIEKLSDGLDIEALQTTASLSINTKKSPKQESGTLAVERKSKQHKKHKGKLPKNYVEGVAPNPERWMPKYERTGYRKKRDRRTKDVIIKGGSQGTTAGQSGQFDFSSKVTEHDGDAVHHVDPSPKGRGNYQQKKGGQWKKKNKRR